MPWTHRLVRHTWQACAEIIGAMRRAWCRGLLDHFNFWNHLLQAINARGGYPAAGSLDTAQIFKLSELVQPGIGKYAMAKSHGQRLPGFCLLLDSLKPLIFYRAVRIHIVRWHRYADNFRFAGR